MLFPLTREEFDVWWEEWGAQHAQDAPDPEYPKRIAHPEQCGFCGDLWPCDTSRIRETMICLGLNYDYPRNQGEGNDQERTPGTEEVESV